MPVFHCHLQGSFWRSESQSRKAEESLRKAIEVAPNYALSRLRNGKLLVQSKSTASSGGEIEPGIQYDAPIYERQLSIKTLHRYDAVSGKN